MLGFLRTLLTKDDNSTFDEIKVGGFLVLVAAAAVMVSSSLLCLHLVLVLDVKAFDAKAYLDGAASVILACAAVVGAMGGGMGLRDNLSKPKGP